MPDLGLQAQAERHLGFLVAENGYRCIESTPYRVRFQSPSTFVELVFDGNRSYELGLLVGKASLAGTRNPPFSIDEILRLRGAEEAGRLSLIQVTSSETMASFVAQLAQVLRSYGSDLLAGNENSFADLAEQRQKEIKAYAIERDLRIARAEAEKAWRSKDYRTVVRVLSPLRAGLTATEVGKLEFAENQIRDTGGRA
jgi:hypothetical protein